MSQIRKLQTGGKSTYGTITIGNTVLDTPEAQEGFWKHMRNANKGSSAIVGKWMDWNREGRNIYINPIDNTISIDGISEKDYTDVPGYTKHQGKVLTSGKQTLGRNDFSTNFRDAVWYAGGYSHSNDSAKSQSSKNKVANTRIEVNYDTENGKQVYSKKNPNNALISPQVEAYLNYLGDEKWGETNEWDGEEINKNTERILRAWYSGFKGDKEAARAAINEALTEVQSKPWNEVSEPSRELLEYFNIFGPDGSSSSTSSSYVDAQGNVKTNAQNAKGQWGTYSKDGALYTTYDAGNTPYLVNAERLGLFEGLDDSYLNSILYGGRFYRPDEVSQNVQLQRIMDEITHINNNAISPIQAYEQLKDKFNYTDYPNSLGNYGMYDASKHYINNKAVRDYLAEKGILNAALFNATAGYNVDDGSAIYGIYDYSHNGTGPYGFRTPFYLIVGADGQLHLTEADENGVQHRHWTSIPYESSGRNYGDANSLIRAKEVINGKTYGRLEVTDRVDGGSYHFVIDENGKVYHVTNNGKLELMDDELASRILAGEQIVRRDVDDSKKRVKHPEQYNSNYRSPITKKEGGKIRELPIKLQTGSRLLTAPTTIEESTPVNDNMSNASRVFTYGWENMPTEDREDVIAALTDIGAAVAALSPDPVTSGLGLLGGVTATGLMTDADRRRGKIHWGRTAVSLGMDVLGAVPYIGTAAKITKLTKATAKSQKLLKNISNVFIGLGFANAVPTLNKLVNEGPKNLTTEDLYALSGAVQASLGVGVRARQRRGDAALAEKISDIKAKKTVAEVPEAKVVKEVEVKLEPEDVVKITEAKEKAGQTLRKKLEANKQIDKEALGTDDNALLKKFGFEVKGSKVKVADGATHTAKVAAKETKLAKAADKVTETVKKAVPGKERYKKNGYITDLWKGASERRAFIDEAMSTPEIRSEIDNALAGLKPNEETLMKRAYGRSQFRIGEEPGIDGRWFSYQKETKPEENITEQTSVQQQSTPQQRSSSQNTSGSSSAGSNVSSTSQQSPNSTVRTPRESNSSVEQVKASAEVVNNASSVTASNVTRSFKTASMEQRAANLQRLQKSANPLKTLSDLEKSSHDKLFTNQEEFEAVLDALIRQNNVRGGQKTVDKYNTKLLDKLASLDKAGRLYKKGGIIKGQIGIPDLKNPYWKNIMNIGMQVPKGPTIPTAPAEVNSPLDPIKERQQELFKKAVDEHTSKMGYRYKNWEGQSSLIQPALSAFRYFSQKWGRNKMYDEQKAALNAGRVNRASISIPTVPTYSTAHQHLENQLRQQMMNGIKPISSDLTAYYATKLQQQSGLNKALQELTAQKSSYEQQANVQNQQLKSQEALQNNEIAFENAKMRASINSGLHQLEAAKLGEEQASRDNLLYEIQQKLYQDQQTMLQSSIAEQKSKANDELDRYMKQIFDKEAASWQTVDQSKYIDFEDYVRQTNPTLYNQRKTSLDNYKEALENDLIMASTKGKMNYPWLYGRLGGYHGPAGYLKGGRVNGKTRYTLEPDERVWIDNNKAAHAKSAKLNDAAIKLLLRALK